MTSMAELLERWLQRLRLAWRFREWPWRIPENVVKYIDLDGPTDADVRRGEELAERFGWD